MAFLYHERTSVLSAADTLFNTTKRLPVGAAKIRVLVVKTHNACMVRDVYFSLVNHPTKRLPVGATKIRVFAEIITTAITYSLGQSIYLPHPEN